MGKSYGLVVMRSISAGSKRRTVALVLKGFQMKRSCPTYELGFVSSHNLVEDVVAPLLRQLERDPGLLQQVCGRTRVRIIEIILERSAFLKEKDKLTGLNVSGRQFSCGSEVNPDEFTLQENKVQNFWRLQKQTKGGLTAEILNSREMLSSQRDRTVLRRVL